MDALAKTASEGFAPHSVIYLDVEPMDHIPQAQIDYVNRWLSQFPGAGFLPGIYCHVKNANQLKASISAFPADQIAFWVSGSGFGGVSIQIDENVADTATPSARLAT